ncbi:MAG: hypothetical protein KAJ23_08250 [Maribacter sp.]|nr:hypothetical protein [Maribacter sp.]
MQTTKNFLGSLLIILVSFTAVAQNDEQAIPQQSNIQQYTPSKLVGKGQWDLKWFNNLYTETRSTFEVGRIPRATFFTSTIEVYSGVGNTKSWNIGAIVEIRSNVINDQKAFDVFKFGGKDGLARSGITSIAPSVKFVPFASASNFSIQSSFFIPLVDNETENGVFLDQKGYVWQNRFYYDHTFLGNEWQLFAELNSELSVGKAGNSFANNSFNLAPGLFLSYFPSSKFTLLVLAQHSQRLDLGNNFTQDYTAMGGGAKYQLTNALNVEVLYTNFLRGNNTGLGQTFNIGLRAIL